MRFQRSKKLPDVALVGFRCFFRGTPLMRKGLQPAHDSAAQIVAKRQLGIALQYIVKSSGHRVQDLFRVNAASIVRC